MFSSVGVESDSVIFHDIHTDSYIEYGVYIAVMRVVERQDLDITEFWLPPDKRECTASNFQNVGNTYFRFCSSHIGNVWLANYILNYSNTYNDSQPI